MNVYNLSKGDVILIAPVERIIDKNDARIMVDDANRVFGQNGITVIISTRPLKVTVFKFSENEE